MGDHTEDHVLADGVLAGSGLVEKHDLRVGDERTRQRNPFLHPAGKLRRVLVRHLGEFRLLDAGHDPLGDLPLAEVRRLFEWKRNVLEHGHRVEERVVLKEVADVAPVPVPFTTFHVVHGRAVKEDHALVRLQEADDVFEEHALSGAALSDDGRDLVFVDLQVDPVKDRLTAEALRNIPEFYERRLHLHLYMRKDVIT